MLNLSENDFSKGLPMVVTKLQSLRGLSVWNCQLADLPDEYVYVMKWKCFPTNVKSVTAVNIIYLDNLV